MRNLGFKSVAAKKPTAAMQDHVFAKLFAEKVHQSKALDKKVNQSSVVENKRCLNNELQAKLDARDRKNESYTFCINDEKKQMHGIMNGQKRSSENKQIE